MTKPTPVFGFAGWSGSGKTTLIEQLIAEFCRQGLAVSLIKHAHHNFDIDLPGKDSYRHREAGAAQVLLSSTKRWALQTTIAKDAAELSLDEAIDVLAPCDLILVEGYKRAPIPKLEIYRSVVGKPLLHPNDTNIIAIATDDALNTPLPTYPLKDIAGISAFIKIAVGLMQPTTSV